jgi:hypothetical protein
VWLLTACCRAHAGTLKLTQPQPFRLQTEARGALHEHEMQAKLAADEARAKRLRRVTARPLPVTLDVPVVPAKPEPKPLTLPDPFPLKSVVSSIRAVHHLRLAGRLSMPHVPAAAR